MSEALVRFAESAARHAAALSWQFALLALLLLAADRWLLRHAWPTVRLALHATVLAKLALPSSLALRGSAATWLQPWFERGAAATGSVIASGDAIAPARTVSLAVPWLVALWLAGALALLLSGARRARRERRLWLARDLGVTPALASAARRAAARLSLRRLPRLVVDDEAASAALVGGGPALLVVPRALLDDARATELDHALLHELAHWRRRDLWFAAAAWLLCVAWWFHPLAWLVARRASALRELCCDETVVRALRGEGGAYRATLRAHARALLAGPRPVAAHSFLLPPATLLLRLEWLARPRTIRPVRERTAGAACAALAAVLLLPMGAIERVAAVVAPPSALRAAALSLLADADAPDHERGCLRRHLAMALLRGPASEPITIPLTGDVR